MTKKNHKMGTSHRPLLQQLKKIEGQVRGVSRMIEERRYCMEITHQIKAVRASLSGVERNIINEHLNHCVHEAVTSKDTQQAENALMEIKELIKSARD